MPYEDRIRSNVASTQQGRAGFENDAAASLRTDDTSAIAGALPAYMLRNGLRLPFVSSESNRGGQCVSNVVRIP